MLNSHSLFIVPKHDKNLFLNSEAKQIKKLDSWLLSETLAGMIKS